MAHYSLTDKELDYLSDTDFLRTKNTIYQKTDQMLSATHQLLREYLSEHSLNFPEGVLIQGGKISRGENYRELPYHVLDFPRKFTREDIFTVRSMVWWGHHLSLTLHIAGDSFDKYKSQLSSKLPLLQAWDWKVCIGDDPWQYHQEESYFQPARRFQEVPWSDWIMKRSWCKLATFTPLNDWEQLPDKAVIFLERIVQLLNL